jgi:hypothetical protein
MTRDNKAGVDLWLACVHDGYGLHKYHLCRKRPVMEDDDGDITLNYDLSREVLDICCPETFEQLFPHMKLRPGYSRLVTITMVDALIAEGQKLGGEQ